MTFHKAPPLDKNGGASFSLSNLESVQPILGEGAGT
jgi:hypothetical protein